MRISEGQPTNDDSSGQIIRKINAFTQPPSYYTKKHTRHLLLDRLLIMFKYLSLLAFLEYLPAFTYLSIFLATTLPHLIHKHLLVSIRLKKNYDSSFSGRIHAHLVYKFNHISNLILIRTRVESEIKRILVEGWDQKALKVLFRNDMAT